jgi:YYY domain-containing protein
MLRAASFTYGGVDRQFPFFSFLIGDLHAHVLAIPLFVMAIAMALNVWSSGQRLGGRFLIENLPLCAVLALSVGALAFTNIWDMPTLFFLLAVLVLVRNYLAAGRLTLVVARDSLAFLLPVGLLAVLLFLPYYLGFSPDSRGVALLEAAHRPPGISLEPVLTRPHHLLYMWLPFLWLAGCFALVSVRRHRWSHIEAIRSLAIASLPLTVWFLAVLVRRGPGVGEEISIRGSNWVTLLTLLVLLSGLVLALRRELAGSPESGDQRPLVVPLIVCATAILLLLGMELYWMDELSGIRRFRFSTVFRLGYQAWILLSIGGAYALYHLTLHRPLARLRDILATVGWAAVTLSVILAALVYAPAAVFWKTGDFHNPRSLDALALTKQFNGAEYESLMWLRDNVKGTPVIVEAVGSYYTAFGRVSVATGLPTVLGWPQHEAQWRGSEEVFAGRQEAVERIYKTTDSGEALALLRRFDAEYVYVGLLERSQYGEGGMSKFAAFMDVVYQNEEVTIYRVRE